MMLTRYRYLPMKAILSHAGSARSQRKEPVAAGNRGLVQPGSMTYDLPVTSPVDAWEPVWPRRRTSD